MFKPKWAVPTLIVLLSVMFGCSNDKKEPKNIDNVAMLRMEFREAYLDGIAINGLRFTVPIENIKTAVDPKRDETYCDVRLVYNPDIGCYTGRADRLTIYVRTSDQKDNWDKALKTVIKKYYAPRDISAPQEGLLRLMPDPVGPPPTANIFAS